MKLVCKSCGLHLAIPNRDKQMTKQELRDLIYDEGWTGANNFEDSFETITGDNYTDHLSTSITTALNRCSKKELLAIAEKLGLAEVSQ